MNVVAVVRKNAAIPIQVTDGGGRGDYVFQARFWFRFVYLAWSISRSAFLCPFTGIASRLLFRLGWFDFATSSKSSEWSMVGQSGLPQPNPNRQMKIFTNLTQRHEPRKPNVFLALSRQLFLPRCASAACAAAKRATGTRNGEQET